MRNSSRREVLAGLGAAILPLRAHAIGAPRIAIIGGGMAGLSCAHRLARAGFKSTVYEWNDRAGGRIETLRGYFANGQTTEQHAEFISSEHRAVRRMAAEFGLALENTYADPQGARDTYWFGGARYEQKALNRDWQEFGYRLFHDAVLAAPRATYLHHSRQAKLWDRMSVVEWIERYVPDGMSGRFGRLCYADAISEYGGPPEEQSALNLVYLLGYNDSAKDFYQSPTHPVLAGSDEKWHVVGGNDLLVSGIMSRLPEGTVALGRRLVALAENADGSFTCTFATGPEIVADHVVLAIPFTVLRDVDLSGVSLSPLKRRAIAELPLGNNVKIQLQVAGRPWTKHGYTGSTLTDNAACGSWDGTTYQHKSRDGEVLIAVPGGAQGARLASKYGIGAAQGVPPQALIDDTLAELEPILPGTTAAWNAGPKLAWMKDGNLDPRLKGAWSQYNVGQYTAFCGIEGVREGNIHFAGEHTSVEFQGFVEGAVRSGLRAAREIVA